MRRVKGSYVFMNTDTIAYQWWNYLYLKASFRAGRDCEDQMNQAYEDFSRCLMGDQYDEYHTLGEKLEDGTIDPSPEDNRRYHALDYEWHIRLAENDPTLSPAELKREKKRIHDERKGRISGAFIGSVLHSHINLPDDDVDLTNEEYASTEAGPSSDDDSSSDDEPDEDEAVRFIEAMEEDTTPEQVAASVQVHPFPSG
jgi:hypothetical protein